MLTLAKPTTKEVDVAYKNLEFDCRDHIGWLTLNRPERHNAISLEMIGELHGFFGSLEERLDVRVVIVRGAGYAFCAGMDLVEAAGLYDKGGTTDQKSPDDSPSYRLAVQRMFSHTIVRMRQAPQPLIAAVRGPAYGGGLSLALGCDVRLAGESARFCAAYIRVGFSGCDMGSSYFLPRLIGLSRAAEYLYTGRVMDAATAERIGFVSKVVPDDQVDQAAEELAQEMLNATPLGLRMTKEVLNVNVDAPSLVAAAELENRTQILCSFTEDAREAGKANFFEKRRPVYHDR